jgi:AAA domain (dynein-related subfamily)
LKLLFLYGPPGTGKLTVAREVARLTGFRLFHNHLTVDLAASLFAHGSPDYMQYVRQLRGEAFERTAAADVSLVFTFWYSSVSQPSVDRYRAIVEAQGGEVLFVRLWCRPEVLEARVASESRQNWKISSVAELRAALEQYPGSFDVIPGTPLEIDTSDFAPEMVAGQIVGYFGLNAQGAATEIK